MEDNISNEDDEEPEIAALKHKNQASERIKLENICYPNNKSQEKSTSSKMEASSKIVFQNYKKRSGTNDAGKEFEYIMCALYALKLCNNKEIVDFKMTTNNEKYGDFDDISLEIETENKTSTFLLQLKHKENEEQFLTNQKLISAKSEFSLTKYLKSFEELNVGSVTCLVYTNAPAKLEIGSNFDISFKTSKTQKIDEGQSEERKINVTVKKPQVLEFLHLLQNKRQSNMHLRLLQNKKNPNNVCDIFQFDITQEKTRNSMLESFCEKYFLMTGQDNLKTIKATVRKKLTSLLKVDIYDSFILFMKEWWSGRHVLKKRDVISKLTELAMSPWIQTVSSTNVNSKTKLLSTAIMNFDITVLKNANDDIINNIWEDTTEETDLRKATQMYHVQENQNKRSRILWFLDKVPLIVRVDSQNEQQVKHTIKLLECLSQKKKIILMGNTGQDDFPEWEVLENLKDLYHLKDIYEEVIRHFRISLQGRKSINLEELLKNSEDFACVIEIGDLLKMAQQECLLIGNIENSVSETYIPRKVSAVSVETTDLLDGLHRVKKHVFIINCGAEYKKTLNTKHALVMELVEFLAKEKPDEFQNLILLSIDKPCTYSEFGSLRKKLGSFQIYLFQTVDSNCCIHLMNVGHKKLLTNYRNVQMEVTEILFYFKSGLNVILAPPGMGKSTLCNVLSKNCPPDLWVICIKLIDQNSFLAKQLDGLQLLRHFLRIHQESHSLDTKILNVYLKNKKILILLDGVDELHSQNVNFLLYHVKLLSSHGFNVWISSRENLHQKISRDIEFFTSVNIVELSENEQKLYIEKRLKDKYNSSVIKEIVPAIFESSDMANSRQLLGIPLQLYIITENFLTNKNLVSVLTKENIFVLTTMYRLFFEGKGKFHLTKVGLDEHLEQLGFNFEHHLKLYELPALRNCLDDEAFQKLNLDECNCQEFLQDVKTKGDKFGIIKSATPENTAVFYHQTYAEYFACKWFEQNLDKVKLLRKEWFSEKYQNLRFMFDIMLSEQSPLHLAVIYNNIEQFRKNVDNCEKDKAGRNVLYLACCYGMKYPLPEKNSGSDSLDYRNCHLERESEIYVEIVRSLLQRCQNIFEEDKLFGMNCISYALSSRCLFVIEAFLEQKLLSFRKIDKLLKNCFEFETIALYASQMDYIHLLKNVLKRIGHTITFYNFGSLDLTTVSLLDVAIIGSRNQHTILPKKENVAAVKKILKYRNKRVISVQNELRVERFEIYFRRKHFIDKHLEDGYLLRWSCEFGCYKIMKILLRYQTTWDSNNILHMTVEFGTLNDEVLELSKTIGLDVNQKNLNDETPLYMACEKGNEQFVKKLLDVGAKIDIQSGELKHNVFHVTAKLERENTAIMQMLLNKMSSEGKSLVNFPDKFGHHPLFFAFERCHINYVKLLLHNGAKINVTGKYGNSILHYAAEKMFSKEMGLLNLLIENEGNINLQNSRGQTSLHLAVKHKGWNKIETLLDPDSSWHQTCWRNQQNEENFFTERRNKVETFLDSGADINVMDNEGMTVLHYVASYSEDTKNIMSLAKSGFIFDLPINGQKVHFVKDTEVWYIVNRFYDSGADINVYVSEKMNDVLYFACDDDIENVKQLVDDGVSLVVENGSRYLFLPAAKHEHRDTLNRLYDFVTDFESMDNEEITVQQYDASAYDDVENIKLLVDNRVNLNAQNNSGKTALHLVVESRNYNKLKALLKFGADVNLADDKKENILHHAMRHLLISKEAEYVSEMLINNDVNLNAQNVSGETPLHLAFQYHDLSLVRFLCRNGADENLLTLERRSMLHYAAESWCNGNITELLQKGFDMNAQDVNGISILHCACRSGRLKNIQILISSGANIHIIDNKQQTILHHAAMSSYPEEDVMKYLVETGVDIYAKNSNGRNALDVAFEYKYFRALQLLIETDAFFDSTKVPWSTLLYYSAFGGCCHGINYLIEKCKNISALDRNADFSLEFLKSRGKLMKNLLLEMTKCVYLVIEVSRNYPTIDYEPRLFIEYYSSLHSKKWIYNCLFGYFRLVRSIPTHH